MWASRTVAQEHEAPKLRIKTPYGPGKPVTESQFPPIDTASEVCKADLRFFVNGSRSARPTNHSLRTMVTGREGDVGCNPPPSNRDADAMCKTLGQPMYSCLWRTEDLSLVEDHNQLTQRFPVHFECGSPAVYSSLLRFAHFSFSVSRERNPPVEHTGRSITTQIN